MSWVRVGGIALLASAVAAGSIRARGGTAIEIGVNDRANANASIATTGSFVGVAWAARTTDGVTDIYATTSRDGGRSFRAPVRVNQIAGEASISGEQPPRIVLVPRPASDPLLVVMWTAKSSPGTRLVSACSNNGGQSFGPAESVPGSVASGNRGWESMAISEKGDVVALWLDHREIPAPAAGGAAMRGAHQHAATGQQQMDGVARAQLSQLFFAKLNDPGSPRAITGGVCYCCKTSVAMGPDGSIFAAWRHVYAGNVRDIALTKSSDGGRTFASPVRVSEDNWALDGCPENGPALTVDQSSRVHVVWPTLIPHPAPAGEPTLGLFYAMSDDGRRFAPRQQIPTQGLPRHAQITRGSSGEILVAWDEQIKGIRRMALARGAPDSNGRVHFIRESLGDEPSATYPVVASVSDGAIVAWTSGTAESSVLRAKRLPR